MSLSMEKKYYHSIRSDIKRYEEIKKLTTGRGKDCTIGCLLDYEYIKNHYRVIAVNLRRQKELDADPKEIQQIEFTGRFKNTDGINSDGTQFIFFFKTLEKN